MQTLNSPWSWNWIQILSLRAKIWRSTTVPWLLLNKVTSDHCSAVKQRRPIGGNKQTNKQTNKETQNFKQPNKETKKHRISETNKETENKQQQQRQQERRTTTTYLHTAMPWEISAYGGKLMKFSPVVLALEHLFKPDLPMTRVALWNPHHWFVSPWGPSEHVMNFGAQPSFITRFRKHATQSETQTYLNGSCHIDILQPNNQIIVIVPIFQAVQIIPEASMDASSLIHFIRSETWAWHHILNLYLKNRHLQAAWIPPFSPATTPSHTFDTFSQHSGIVRRVQQHPAWQVKGRSKVGWADWDQTSSMGLRWCSTAAHAAFYHQPRRGERNGCLVSIGLQGQCAGRYTPEIGSGSLQAHVAHACLCQLW